MSTYGAPSDQVERVDQTLLKSREPRILLNQGKFHIRIGLTLTTPLHRWIARALVLLAFVACTAAQAGFMPAYTVMRAVDDFDLQLDGSYRQYYEWAYRIDTPQGISDLGELRLSYNEKLEDLEVLEAYTLQPDGTRVDVPADKIRKQDGDGGQEYSDSKAMVVIYPKVEVGSRLFIRARSHQHTPLFPGHFLMSRHFSPHFVFEDTEIRISTQAGVKLQIDTNGVSGGQVEPLPEDAPGTMRYRFTFKQAQAYPYESGQANLSDFAPYLAVSTFANYADFAQAYQVRAKPMAAVTPAIEKLAKELTANAKDERDKVRKLFNWVSQNIRYVAVYVGEGGFVPHAAQSTLDNRYGDCKDHVTLLEALLEAVGIESTTALVNSGGAYQLPKLAVSTPFDHAITYLPSLDLYLDSTSRFSPMGTLPHGDKGKPTLLTASGTIGQTPVNSWKSDYNRSRVQMRMRKDGSFVGKSTTVMRGIEEVNSRGNQFANQNDDQTPWINGLLASHQETGTGRIWPTEPTNLDTPWAVEAEFQLDPLVNVPGPSAMTIPYGLAPGRLHAMASHKAIEAPRYPQRCSSAELRETTTLKFPTNMKITRIPSNVQGSFGSYHYQSRYTLKGHTLLVDRLYRAKRTSTLCETSVNHDWNRFREVLQRDLRGQVFFK